MVVGCSSMNSSGAGTNMLTVLGAESKLVFVGPTKEEDNNVFNFLSFLHRLGVLYFLKWSGCCREKLRASDRSPRCRCCAARWIDAPAASSSADSSSELQESLVSPAGTELKVTQQTKTIDLHFFSVSQSQILTAWRQTGLNFSCLMSLSITQICSDC